jgi:hypothetical protein
MFESLDDASFMTSDLKHRKLTSTLSTKTQRNDSAIGTNCMYPLYAQH